jgi:hypothetical protein
MLSVAMRQGAHTDSFGILTNTLGTELPGKSVIVEFKSFGLTDFQASNPLVFRFSNFPCFLGHSLI